MTLTIQLPEEQEAALKTKAAARGVSTEEYARLVLDQDLKSADQGRRHISDIIRDIMSDVPAEVLERLPEDGASEHDHYLYGSPKRKQ
jgi:plasmid stability protein